MPRLTRKERRYQRYHYLRELGFSAKEARRLRDTSGDVTTAYIDGREAELLRKRKSNRSPIEQTQLEKIRATRRGEDFKQETVLYSYDDRYERFSQWSSKFVGFPSEYLRRIRAINAQADLDENDSYGFRWFYYYYVEEIDEFEALMLADRRDT